MRADNWIRYALLGILSKGGPQNDWDLRAVWKQVFEMVGFCEIDSVLEELATEGLVERALAKAGGTRGAYCITGDGKRSLDDFTLTPPTDTSGDPGQELFVKFMFMDSAQIPDLRKWVVQHRAICMQQA